MFVATAGMFRETNIMFVVSGRFSALVRCTASATSSPPRPSARHGCGCCAAVSAAASTGDMTILKCRRRNLRSTILALCIPRGKPPTLTAVNDDGGYAFARSGVQPAFDPATYT